jgi:hypothetical protein
VLHHPGESLLDSLDPVLQIFIEQILGMGAALSDKEHNEYADGKKTWDDEQKRLRELPGVSARGITAVFVSGGSGMRQNHLMGFRMG